MMYSSSSPASLGYIQLMSILSRSDILRIAQCEPTWKLLRQAQCLRAGSEYPLRKYLIVEVGSHCLIDTSENLLLELSVRTFAQQLPE